MRQRYFSIAIVAVIALGTATAQAGDREIAEQIIQRLNDSRDSGALKGFTLDMKVDRGVVLFRGQVSDDAHRAVVLSAADGIEGIAQVIDEISLAGSPAQPASESPAADHADHGRPEPAATASPSPQATAAKPAAVDTATGGPATAKPTASVSRPPVDSQSSLGEALAAEVRELQRGNMIRRTAAYEGASDERVVSDVVKALQRAQRDGLLRGFGVDVKSRDGVLQLTGRAGSADQREQIVRIAESVPGVSGIREAISIPTSVEELPAQPEGFANPELTPLNPPEQLLPPLAPHPVQQTPVRSVAGPSAMPATAVPYRRPAPGMSTAAMPASNGMMVGAPVMGQPVPMAPHSPVGAPRYDSPNLPNYAWPGYAAYPNYAALTYPQQYSPTAWPYIGPFYPYPQVPLGWRKISLEWDDGWWFLDFTDK